MNVCPTCSAATNNGTPHPEGEPCPQSVLVMAANVAEVQARTRLLEAQRSATIAKSVR